MIFDQNRSPKRSWSKIGRHDRQPWLPGEDFVLRKHTALKPFARYSDRLLGACPSIL